MTTAIVTGFTVHQELMRRSFAPLMALRRSGLIDRILYVTWDAAAIDAYVAPAREWPEVELVRVPQPEVRGAWHRAGFVYQNRAIAAALRLVDDPDELVLKTRPDFLFDEAFLAGKIARFGEWSKRPDFSHRLPVAMPPSPFKARIWVPWADGSAPFYFEDATFMGRSGDLGLLVNPLAEELAMQCGDDKSVNLAHVLRHIMPFLADYPIFTRYVSAFHLFRIDPEYRAKLSPLAANDPFFWHMAMANAWILATSYHVDCGRRGQMRLVFSANARQHIDKPIAEIPDTTVYHEIERLRGFEQPGTFLPLLFRTGGRLMDDDWQFRLFDGPVEQGFTYENQLFMLENIARYRSGALAGLEAAFYDRLDRLYRELEPAAWPNQRAVA